MVRGSDGGTGCIQISAYVLGLGVRIFCRRRYVCMTEQVLHHPKI